MFSPKEFFSSIPTAFQTLFPLDKPAWMALTLIEAYLKTHSLGKIEVEIPKGVFLVDEHLISIGKGTVIEPGAYIRGPCIIGENCIIRHGAYIRGNLITGKECVIGHGSEVKNAIFFDKAHAPHLNYVGDSILGFKVNLGAGSICSNLKLDNTTVIIHHNNEDVDTGLRKFGAIVGDEGQIGCNAVLNPGTLLGKNVACYPCVNVSGYVESDSIVKGATKSVVLPKKAGK